MSTCITRLAGDVVCPHAGLSKATEIGNYFQALIMDAGDVKALLRSLTFPYVHDLGTTK